MFRETTVESVELLARKAVQAGNYPEVAADLGRFRRNIKFDVSGRCEHARTVVVHGRWSSSHFKAVRPMTVELQVRCRKCRWCKASRSRLWAEKAANEFNHAPRTWFLTLTFAPGVHYQRLAQARLRNAGYDDLAADRRFALLVAEYGPDITRFIKRVRKNSRAPCRYLLVAERHSRVLEGYPHFHMLVHEVDADRPIRKAVLKNAWQEGFCKVVLAHDARSALYLCKYLSKEASTRIRASFKYGKIDRQIIGLQKLG